MTHKELIREVVQKIKVNPALTLTQYNNYLSTKTWYEQVIIRYFVYKMGTGLAELYKVALSDYTEQQVLKNVRDFIAKTENTKLSKIIFGTLTDL